MSLYRGFQHKYDDLRRRNFYLHLSHSWDELLEVQGSSFPLPRFEPARFDEACRIEPARPGAFSVPDSSSGVAHEESLLGFSRWLVTSNHDPVPDPPESTASLGSNVTGNTIPDSAAMSLNFDGKAALQFPDLSALNSIQELDRALATLTNLSESLPFLANTIREKRGDFADAERVFSALTQSYLTLQDSTSSFLGESISRFLHAFEHLCGLLLKSGIPLEGFSSDFCTRVAAMEKSPDFVEGSEIVQFPAPASQWELI
jgi:hypothetical protein